jgi:phage N-6-adenine-methyltransferase
MPGSVLDWHRPGGRLNDMGQMEIPGTETNGSRGLELSGLYGKPSRTGYEAPEGMTPEEWASDGEKLSAFEAASKWMIGDWARAGEKWGDKYEAVIEATGLAYDSVAKAKWVAGSVEFCRRRQKLSFSHHAEVASLLPERADELLSLAETNGWSVRRLREEAGLSKGAPLIGDLTAQNHRAQGTGENEWYTPEAYVEAAREVLGGFDLDPATSEEAQKRIKATAWFTAEDDGLDKPWTGRVWLNPPYSQPLIHQFVAKLVEEVEAGNVTEAILLTHNYTDTGWFHLAEEAAANICFTRGRIRFEGADGSLAAPTQGQAFFYFGQRGGAFRQVFSQWGFVR